MQIAQDSLKFTRVYSTMPLDLRNAFNFPLTGRMYSGQLPNPTSRSLFLSSSTKPTCSSFSWLHSPSRCCLCCVEFTHIVIFIILVTRINVINKLNPHILHCILVLFKWHIIHIYACQMGMVMVRISILQCSYQSYSFLLIILLDLKFFFFSFFCPWPSLLHSFDVSHKSLATLWL